MTDIDWGSLPVVVSVEVGDISNNLNLLEWVNLAKVLEAAGIPCGVMMASAMFMTSVNGGDKEVPVGLATDKGYLTKEVSVKTGKTTYRWSSK